MELGIRTPGNTKGPTLRVRVLVGEHVVCLGRVPGPAAAAMAMPGVDPDTGDTP